MAFEGFKVLELKFEKSQAEGLQVCLPRRGWQHIKLAPDSGIVLLPLHLPEAGNTPTAITAIACDQCREVAAAVLAMPERSR